MHTGGPLLLCIRSVLTIGAYSQKGRVIPVPALVYCPSFVAASPSKDRKLMDMYLEFAANHALLVTALLFSFFLLVFTELRRQASGVTNLEPQAAVKLINADAVVLDLRSADSFALGHIVNAKNIPFDELEANQDKIDKFKSQPILAVCNAGVSSNKVVNKLRKSGVENIYGLKGGITAWTQANLPLVTSKKTKRKK